METFSLPGGEVPEKAPLGTWDVRSAHRDFGHWSAWWKDHIGPDTLRRCYRASFYVMDCALLVGWCYDESERGVPYLDGNGILARLPPQVLILAELPPARLLGHRGYDVLPVHTEAFRLSPELAMESDRGSWGWEYGQGSPRLREDLR
jgi:hypothetical protein